MAGQAKKKLIIVVGEKTSVYGDLLTALITAKDDTEENVVGIKDDSVETVIWTEKIFHDNQAQLGSGNKIIFIGKNETSNSVIRNIKCSNDFTDYGICYGCLSNRAVIYLSDTKLSADKEKYDEFYEKYKEYLTSLGTEFALSQINDKVNVINENFAESKKEQNAFTKKIMGVFHKVDKAVAKFVSTIKNTNDITDQQYRLAVFSFYMKSLSNFVGE